MFFFFNDTATTEIYTLPLHDALPISPPSRNPPAMSSRTAKVMRGTEVGSQGYRAPLVEGTSVTRGSIATAARSARASALRSEETRLNSSHANISYAVFCLKKKKKKTV